VKTREIQQRIAAHKLNCVRQGACDYEAIASELVELRTAFKARHESMAPLADRKHIYFTSPEQRHAISEAVERIDSLAARIAAEDGESEEKR
jgi:hypothetical protein